MRDCKLLSAMLGLSICAGVSEGMLTAESGPDSARGHATISQPGWPVGLVELPRHESRVYSVWVNGYESFYFKTNPVQTNELILLFSKTRMRDHELFIRERKSKKESVLPQSIDYNVSLDISGALQMDETSKTYEPTLTVYIDTSA